MKSLDPEEGMGMGMDVDEDGNEGAGKKTKREMWRGGEEGLAEGYDYVMYGKVSSPFIFPASECKFVY